MRADTTTSRSMRRIARWSSVALPGEHRAAGAALLAFAVAALVLAALTACRTPAAASSDDAVSASTGPVTVANAPTGITIHATGGIAGMEIVRGVARDGPLFSTFTRRLCSGTRCTPATDSAAGALQPARAASVWSEIEAARTDTMRADYGIGRGADQMFYEIRIALPSGERVLRADDFSMPPALRKIVERVDAAIREQRGG